MRDKATILRTMEEQRAELDARYRAMPPEVLSTPCTQSESEGGQAWTPKDHLAHLLRIEEAFLAAARRTLLDEERPLRFTGSTREEVLAGIHRDNEEHVISLRDLDLDHVLVTLEAARTQTLTFIETLDEDQLDTKIPGAPWSDGTIGGVLMANAHHERQHLSWVEEGLGGEGLRRGSQAGATLPER